MNRIFACVSIAAILLASGCGGGGNTPSVVSKKQAEVIKNENPKPAKNKGMDKDVER